MTRKSESREVVRAALAASRIGYRAEGLTLTNPAGGHTFVHPCVSIAHQAGALLHRLAGEFGLTASPTPTPLRPSSDC